MNGARRRRRPAELVAVGAIAGIGVGLAAAFAGALRARGITLSVAAYHAARDGAIADILKVIPWRVASFPVGQWLRHAFFSPPFFLATAAILLLEWAWPVSPDQPLLSPSFVQDLLWYLASIGGFVLVGGWFYGEIRGLFQAHLRFLEVRVAQGGPAWVRAIGGVVIGDFLAWLHHLIRHKVRPFWLFHEVHHAQRSLNAWTNERAHVVDVLIAVGIQSIPLLALGVSPAATGAYVVAASWYTRLCHANVRGNFGLLRYVLVTPQSHRLHHSVRPEHEDQNFGVIFSVWDRLFGTLNHDVDTYPETGVADNAFPIERGYADVLGLRAFIRQQLYPFRAAAEMLRGNRM